MITPSEVNCSTILNDDLMMLESRIDDTIRNHDWTRNNVLDIPFSNKDADFLETLQYKYLVAGWTVRKLAIPTEYQWNSGKFLRFYAS